MRALKRFMAARPPEDGAPPAFGKRSRGDAQRKLSRCAGGVSGFAQILLVEDDPLHRRIVRLLLADTGINLTEVEDGQAALDLLSIRRFDLLLLDTSLPRITGPETLGWLRRSHTPWSDIPAMALVGPGEGALAQRMSAIGLEGKVAKPIDRADFYDALVRVLPALRRTA